MAKVRCAFKPLYTQRIHLAKYRSKKQLHPNEWCALLTPSTTTKKKNPSTFSNVQPNKVVCWICWKMWPFLAFQKEDYRVEMTLFTLVLTCSSDAAQKLWIEILAANFMSYQVTAARHANTLSEIFTHTHRLIRRTKRFKSCSDLWRVLSFTNVLFKMQCPNQWDFTFICISHLKLYGGTVSFKALTG